MDLTNGQMLFEDLQFEEGWWISVYHFFNGIAVFQVYEDSQDIEAKSYFAFDTQAEEALWSMDKVQAVGRQGHFVQLRAEEAGDALFWIDSRSGETFGAFPDQNMLADIPHAAQFPLHYTEEVPYFQTVQAFLKQRFDVEIHEACDYLETERLICIAYHQRKPESLSHHLLVLDREGTPLLHQLLDESLQGLVSGAFFIAGEQLIFVEGRRTLKSYLIG